MKTTWIAVRLLSVLTLLTGVIYPGLVWLVGQVAFRHQAEGSLVTRDGTIVGSSLVAQKTDDPRYFWPRPSAADYATVASGASNLAWTSARLAARMRSAPSGRPPEMLTTSGSGLDPDIRVETALAQLDRVARARGWTEAQRVRCREWIATMATGGHLGPACVNVLMLNLRIDRMVAES